MNRSDEENAFLRAGLNHYADAFIATIEFRRRVCELLERAVSELHGRGGWERIGREKRPTRCGDAQAAAPYVGLAFDGALPSGRKVDLEIGIWWHATERHERPATYAAFWSDAKKLPVVVSNGAERLEKHNGYLMREMGTDLDIEHELRALLEALVAGTAAPA